MNSVFGRLINVLDSKVQVSHLLLGLRFLWPHRRLIGRVSLEQQAGISALLASLGISAGLILIEGRYIPIQERRVKPGQPGRIPAVYRE